MKKTMAAATAIIAAMMLSITAVAAEAQRSILICSECGAVQITEITTTIITHPAGSAGGPAPVTTLEEVLVTGGCEHLHKLE